MDTRITFFGLLLVLLFAAVLIPIGIAIIKALFSGNGSSMPFLLLGLVILPIFFLGFALLSYRGVETEPLAHRSHQVARADATIPILPAPPSTPAPRKQLEARIAELEKKLEKQLALEEGTANAIVEEIPEKKEDKKALKKEREEIAASIKELKEEQKQVVELPGWINSHQQIEVKDLHLYVNNQKKAPDRFVVSSGRFTTTKESQKAAEELAVSVIYDKLRKEFKLNHAFGEQPEFYVLPLNQNEVQQLVTHVYHEKNEVKFLEKNSASMYRTHLLIEVKDEKIQGMLTELKKRTSMDRLSIAGVSLFGIMLTSSIIGFFFSRASLRQSN